jgi:hypothetical protein
MIGASPRPHRPGRSAHPDGADGSDRTDVDTHHECAELADGQADDQLADDRRDQVAPGPPWPVLRASCPRQPLTRSDRARQ